MFAGEHSTSGHLVPRLLLAGQGLPAEASFRELRYAGSHAAVLAELQAGRADVGACGLGEFRQAQARGQADDLVLLWASDDIPLGPVVCQPGLPAAGQQALRELLLTAHRTRPAAFAQLCRGWAEAAAAAAFVPVLPYEYEAFFRVADTGDEQAHGLPGRGAELRRLLAEYVR